MRKRILNLLVPLLAVPTTSVADELHSLIISFHEGDSVAIVLADKPKATPFADSLRVETEEFCASYLRSEIANFHFGWYDPTANGIASLPEHMVRIVYADNAHVLVQGIDSASKVAVYTLNGNRVEADYTPLVDGVSVNLAACPTGIYIINVNNKQTFKIIKR